MLIVTASTHLDHAIPTSVLSEVLNACVDATLEDGATAPFIRSVLVSSPVPCALYGPLCGDPAISIHDPRLYFGPRALRPYISRLYDAPVRPSNLVTVIGGRYNDDPNLVHVWTLFGGPLAPRECGDPSISSHEELLKSLDFWNQHAIALPRSEYYAQAESAADSAPEPVENVLEEPVVVAAHHEWAYLGTPGVGKSSRWSGEREDTLPDAGYYVATCDHCDVGYSVLGIFTSVKLARAEVARSMSACNEPPANTQLFDDNVEIIEGTHSFWHITAVPTLDVSLDAKR